MPSATRLSWVSAVFVALASFASLATAQASPAVFQTLTLDPDRSQVDLDLTFADDANHVGGQLDVQYDLGPGQSQSVGVPQIRGVLTEEVGLNLGFLNITAPANSITVTATAAPGSLQNTATSVPSIPDFSVYQFTQPDITLSLAGTLTLSDGEQDVLLDLATVAPSTDQSIVDAQLIFDLGINNPPSTTLVAPIDSVFALPLGDITIPVLITGTLTATSEMLGIKGDYDQSGQVDQGDLNLVLNSWGETRTFEDPTRIPFTTDIIDQEELNCVINNWGASAAPRGLEAIHLPEPGAALLLSGLLAGFCPRRPSSFRP